jgi:cytochrome c-type biogenesis protein CcsB
MHFIDETRGAYKLQEYVNAAYAKKPAQRDMFDKEILKVDERLNICYMVFTGEILKILPDPNDPYKSWYSPTARISGVSGDDSVFLVSAIPTYLHAVGTNDIGLANELVKGIKVFQNRFGAEIMPSERKINMEITYNKMLIFDNLSRLYGLLGFIMLIFVFVEVFKKSKAVNYVIKGLTILVILGFLLQTIGLAMRWYISGHAPWSNGYESLIYIGWVTMLAGILFSRRSNMTLAATTVLTSIILMVAHLSWMDPEITNLVPVLKSYWLTIHVSIITASYGFLALGMLLGFINLILMIFKSKNNFRNLESKIEDLTAINERTLMIGLYMLTIGTFLGGVWANESWGRYWGWDPKETWALVSVLVYSFILHMHYVPGLKNYFSFNFASLIGYFSILMTYFGVNYYLSGLHSYAAGDPVPIPTFVYYTIAIIGLVSLWAYINNRRFVKELK